VGWERRRRRRNRGREFWQMGGYIIVFFDGITDGFLLSVIPSMTVCHVTVRLSQFESLSHSVGKIIWRHHAVAYFQTNCITGRQNGRYIPTVSPTDLGCRYIPIDFETELFPSVIITDGKIPLDFSGFLVVKLRIGI
jgi:hypothetical protein